MDQFELVTVAITDRLGYWQYLIAGNSRQNVLWKL